MAKFDLKGMLSERSAQEMDIPEQKTVYRNPEDLIPSKDNFYSTEDTEKLKQSIKALGILQPLLIEERDGKDYLLAGHRRRKCCMELIAEGLDRFKRIPCVYKPKIEFNTETETDEIVRKIVIIQSNTYREKTDWEKMTESLQMEELVKELREKTDLEGKTREIVSDLIGVSSTQIGRYHSISSNLSDPLMDAFKQSKLNVSTAAELAGLNGKYQTEAHKILEETGQVTLNAAKLLKAQQEQGRDIPGQMTIDQALHPHKPEEINTPVPVDIQIDRFYESLRKNIETYVKKSDLNMTTYMLSALYGTVRVRNGQLNYQGTKEGILFNAGSDQEELMSWVDFSKKLIEKYGKKQKPVKMAAVDEPELTIKEAITRLHNEHSELFARMMRAIRPAKNNHESAIMAQKALAPYGFNAVSGFKEINYEFRGMSAGAKFEYKGRTLNASYRYLVEQARFMYDPFSPEFDKPEEEKKSGKCIHRAGHDCTLTEAQKLAAGDGENCNEKCCWNCTKHGLCGYECNSSAHRPEERCQLAVEPQDEKQQSDIVEPAKIEEHSAETDETIEHIGGSNAMLPETWPEFLKDIPVPTDIELNDCLGDQESKLRLLVEAKKESPGLPHTTVLQQQMIVAGLRLLGKLIENMEAQE